MAWVIGGIVAVLIVGVVFAINEDRAARLAREIEQGKKDWPHVD